MNNTKRESTYLTKNEFTVTTPQTEDIRAFQYVNGVFSPIALDFTPVSNGFFVAAVDSELEGHYFICSGRNFQSIRKGYSPIKMFIYDYLLRSDLEIDPISFANDGTFIGTNEYSYLGNGIYEILPIGSVPAIVDIFGRIYHSFAVTSNIPCSNSTRVASSVALKIDTSPLTMTVTG